MHRWQPTTSPIGRTTRRWLLLSATALTLGACSNGADGGADTADTFVIPTQPSGAPDTTGTTDTTNIDTTDGTDTSDTAGATDSTGAGGGVASSSADVVRAGEVAAAEAGGEAVRSSVDLMGYLVELRQPDGSFTTVQLDIGFGVVFVEADEDGRRRADELADDVDLGRAVDLALDVALGEPIGAAGDGVVVGAELEPDGYDIDIQYPDGRVLEVRLDDAFVFTGTRIRS